MCFGRRATIVGTQRADVLRGTARADVIVALGGNDRITGLGRGDRICAGAGNDVIITAGDRGARDLIACSAGRDRLIHDRADRILGGCERRLLRR
jgi:Ca2+-binding RTX toxin-like protein